MAIPYDYYRIFYYVAQHKSFTKAAEALGNNQPNITRCMNNLEQDLGCKLFVRTNHGVSRKVNGFTVALLWPLNSCVLAKVNSGQIAVCGPAAFPLPPAKPRSI